MIELLNKIRLEDIIFYCEDRNKGAVVNNGILEGFEDEDEI